SSVVTANIRDRRPWARGAYRRILRNTADYTTASASFVAIDATNLAPRVECTGNPIRMHLAGSMLHSAVSALVLAAHRLDSTVIDGASANGYWEQRLDATANTDNRRELMHSTVPAAGSHLFDPAFAVVTAGTFTMRANSTNPLLYVIEEIVRQNTDNT